DVGGPVLGFVDVAFRAGVGGADPLGEIGTGDAQAVVAAGIDAHVGRLGHVAFDAARSGAADGMEMVGRGVVGIGLVAAHAKGVSGRDEFHRVRMVAVGAA